MARSLELNRRLAAAAVVFVGAAAALALTAGGCDQPSSPAPFPAITSMDTNPLAQVRAAMDRRQYEAAAKLLRELLVRHPSHLEAHYRLGVSASYLDRPDEAGREFEWVVTRAAPGAREVQLARDWLAARRVRVSSPTPAAAQVAPAAPPVSAEPPAANPELASLAGRAVGREGVKSRLQLFLKGVPGTPVRNEYHLLRTDQQGYFRFSEVVPGEYMLTNAIAGAPTWRLRVSLTKGEHLVLDLTPANQAAVRDDFPAPQS
jgi:hypothetical protein